MRHLSILTAALLLAVPAFAQGDEPEPRSSSEAVAQTRTHPSPNAIVDAAETSEWVQIPAEDLLVMTLAPDRDGAKREVVIQLMPAPFSQGWVSNVRTLARARWYDGISVNRVQDNYVVQWGDPNHDNPASSGEAKPLPDGLKVMGEVDYMVDNIMSVPDPRGRPRINYNLGAMMMRNAMIAGQGGIKVSEAMQAALERGDTEALAKQFEEPKVSDNYAKLATIALGWPLAGDLTANGQGSGKFWPVHCYGMVGVGRGYSPDTGSGAELYTVIGHAPRHLDRNIALVGRIISGMEHLSSMKRGSGPLGFYTEEEASLRTPIQSIRVVSDKVEGEQPASSSEAVGDKYAFEYLSTESESFAKYAEARANRRDPFFIKPAGGADICNIPVPVRPASSD